VHREPAERGRKELPEDYTLSLKVRSYYLKIGASGTTIYTRV